MKNILKNKNTITWIIAIGINEIVGKKWRAFVWTKYTEDKKNAQFRANNSILFRNLCHLLMCSIIFYQLIFFLSFLLLIPNFRNLISCVTYIKKHLTDHFFYILTHKNNNNRKKTTRIIVNMYFFMYASYIKKNFRCTKENQ